MKIILPSQYDFLPRFYSLAFTNIISSIVVPLSGLIDLAFLGHLSDIRYLAGVSLATILFNYLYRLLNFLRSSSNGMTAQAVGASDKQAILLILVRNILIALGLGILILIFQYPFQRLGFTFLIGTTAVKDAGLDYFNARIWGAPAVLINFVLVGWFFGQEMNGFVVLLSVLESLANVLLDYVFIIQWGWASTGAGLTTTISQYLALLVGLMIVFFRIDWLLLPVVTQKIFDWSAIKAIFALKSNMLISNLALVFTLFIFINLSSALGTNVLAENTLLFQAIGLNMFILQGVAFATQSLSGNFKGQGSFEQLQPILIVAVLSSLVLAVPLALMYILFPDIFFGILTNHIELIEDISSYVTWCLPFQVFGAITLMLEGYFTGLTEGKILRNSSLTAFSIGFAPMALAAWYFHSNHLLWLAMILSLITATVMFLLRLVDTFTGEGQNSVISQTTSES